MSEFRPVMPFPKTQVEMSPRSNRGACRATPVWKPVILNDWAIQISASVARFRGNVRSCRAGSTPQIEKERIPGTRSQRSNGEMHGVGGGLLLENEGNMYEIKRIIHLKKWQNLL